MTETKRTLAHSKVTLAALYLTYFSDLVAWSIVLLIFAPLLIAKSSPFLPASDDIIRRNLLMGTLLAAYPLTQFFAAPLLGEWSDRFGRKRVLLYTTLCSSISFAIAAGAIFIHSLGLLYFSRLLGGVAGGNITLSQASVIDVTDENERGRYMALFSVTGGLAWILGPYVGALLSNSDLVGWFNYTVPFWMIALLFLICFLLLWISFKENTLGGANNRMIRQSVANLMHIFKLTQIRIPFIVMAMFYLGWFLFISFLSAYLLEKFSLDKAQIGKMFAFLAICFFAGGLVTSQWLLKKFTAKTLIFVPFVLFAATPLVSVFFNHSRDFWWVLAFAGGCQAVVSSCLYTIFAELSGRHDRGKVFGSLNAMMALSLVVTPPVSAFLANQWIGLPGMMSGALLLAGLILYSFWYSHHRTLNHN